MYGKYILMILALVSVFGFASPSMAGGSSVDRNVTPAAVVPVTHADWTLSDGVNFSPVRRGRHGGFHYGSYPYYGGYYRPYSWYGPYYGGYYRGYKPYKYYGYYNPYRYYGYTWY